MPDKVRLCFSPSGKGKRMEVCVLRRVGTSTDVWREKSSLIEDFMFTQLNTKSELFWTERRPPIPVKVHEDYC